MKLLKHSAAMIKKTFRNYMMLSITVFLTFTFLLGFLIYTDSGIYNKYKELMGNDYKIILSHNRMDSDSGNKINILTSRLEEMGDTHFYYIKKTLARDTYGNQCRVQILPNYVWAVFEYGDVGVERVEMNGEKSFTLQHGEALVSDRMYENLKKSFDREPEISMVFEKEGNNKKIYKFNIVGTYTPKQYENTQETGVEDPIYISGVGIDDSEYEIHNYQTVIRTDKPSLVINCLKSMNMSIMNVMDEQNNAIKEENIVIRNKYIIAAVLFVILGINLYSAFSNALNERKYEIGIKRAIGAGKKDIMMQFLTEGIIVMGINIFLSIVASINIFVIYKAIMFYAKDYRYVICLSGQSVILYAVLTVSISALFSTLFAYKCTRVEIVKYLKE